MVVVLLTDAETCSESLSTFSMVTLLTCGRADLWNPSSCTSGGEDWEGTVEDLESDSLSSSCAGRIRKARGHEWGDRGGRDSGMRFWETQNWVEAQSEGTVKQVTPLLWGQGGPPGRGKENWRSRDKKTREQSNPQVRKMWTSLPTVLFSRTWTEPHEGKPNHQRFRASG